MPFCPKCLTEYVDGTEKCEDCGAALSPGGPPARMPVVATSRDKTRALGRLFRSLVGVGESDDSPEVRTVRVRTFWRRTAPLDAEMARNLLEAHGIPAIVQGEVSQEMQPFLEVPLLVSSEDAARATQILKDYLDTPGPQLLEESKDVPPGKS